MATPIFIVQQGNVTTLEEVRTRKQSPQTRVKKDPT